MTSIERGKVAIQDAHEEDCHVQNLSSFGNTDDIKVRMIFTSERDLYDAYNSYAISKGFGVRRGQKFWRKSEQSGGVLLCSCEGKSEACSSHKERERERLENRRECKARLKYKITNGIWEVVEFKDDHSHEMVVPNRRHYISSARKLTSATRRIIDSLVDSGVGPTKAFKFLVNQAGGIQNVGCIEQDVHNHQQSRRKNLINGGDAQALIDYFSKKKLKDSNFYYTFQLDEVGRLCNVFWRNSVSRSHYECFGDVIIFDTTYRTNKWNMAFAPFVGLNNHWKNIYFGCAFLHDETSASFQGLFKSFLDSMGGKEPKTIFTDQDPAMAIAIKNVFSISRHRLCEWHIEKNATQNIPHLFGKPTFKEKFNKLLWQCNSESEFEIIWKDMIDEWNAEDNTWLKRLYNLRGKWCPALNKDTFSGDIRSTQRGESANKVFGGLSCQSTTLVEFAKKYNKKARDLLDSEGLDDHKTRGSPKIKVRDCGILEEAAKEYTRTIYFKFEDEFLQCVSDWTASKRVEGHLERYTIHKEKSDKIFFVDFDPAGFSIVCSCHMFETLGWLCRHALRIMHIHLGLKSIPHHYILKRWTKGAKQGITVEQDMLKSCKTAKSSVTTRLNDLLTESFSVMSLAAENDMTMNIAREHLKAAKNEIVEHQNRFFDCEDDDMLEHDISAKNLVTYKVKDPVNKRRKGQRNCRLKSFHEKKRTRRASNKTSNFQPLAQDKNASMVNLDVELDEQMELYGNQTVSFTQLLSQVNQDVGTLYREQQVYEQESSR